MKNDNRVSSEEERQAHAQVVGGAASLAIGRLLGGHTGRGAERLGVSLLREGVRSHARRLVRRHRTQLSTLKKVLTALDEIEAVDRREQSVDDMTPET